MSKYQPLTDHLRGSGAAVVPMTFEQVERVIGAKLPPSARKRAWWSNNPTNNVMTKAWLAAGYESTRVDMTDGKLVFRLTRGSEGGRGGEARGGAPVPGGAVARTNAVRRPVPDGGDGSAPDERGAPGRAGGSDWFAGFYGGLRGTVTIAPGTDLTAPPGETWDAELDR